MSSSIYSYIVFISFTMTVAMLVDPQGGYQSAPGWFDHCCYACCDSRYAVAVLACFTNFSMAYSTEINSTEIIKKWSICTSSTHHLLPITIHDKPSYSLQLTFHSLKFSQSCLDEFHALHSCNPNVLRFEFSPPPLGSKECFCPSFFG